MNTQKIIEKFERENEAALIRYFSYNIFQGQITPSPINLKRFYITQALKTLAQLEDPYNQALLEDLIQDSVMDKVH